MELMWCNGLTDQAMPYFINMTREYHTKMESLTKEVNELKIKTAKYEGANGSGLPTNGTGLLGPAGFGNRLMITDSSQGLNTPQQGIVPLPPRNQQL